MIHVEKRDLPFFLAQHEEHRIEQFRQFRQKIYVNSSRDLEYRVRSNFF